MTRLIHKTCPTWGLTECLKDRWPVWGAEPKVTERWEAVTCPDCLERRKRWPSRRRSRNRI